MSVEPGAPAASETRRPFCTGRNSCIPGLPCVPSVPQGHDCRDSAEQPAEAARAGQGNPLRLVSSHHVSSLPKPAAPGAAGSSLPRAGHRRRRWPVPPRGCGGPTCPPCCTRGGWEWAAAAAGFWNGGRTGAIPAKPPSWERREGQLRSSGQLPVSSRGRNCCAQRESRAGSVAALSSPRAVPRNQEPRVKGDTGDEEVPGGLGSCCG